MKSNIPGKLVLPGKEKLFEFGKKVLDFFLFWSIIKPVRET